MEVGGEQRYKIVVYAPAGSAADAVRNAMGEAGAGRIGDYSFCTFTVTGTGRFRPEAGANPTIGEVGRLEEVVEERIETVCSVTVLDEVLTAIRRVHPYEEPAVDVYPVKTI